MKSGKRIAKGNTAEIYLCNNKAFKVYKNYVPNTVALYEANKQKLAHSFGLSVPAVMDITNIEGKQAIVMEYIEGRTLGELVSENRGIMDFYMELSIDVQRNIHSVLTDAFEDMKDKLRRQIGQADLLEKRNKMILLNKIEEIAYEKRLCHGDFHLYNLIKTDHCVTIIDWIDSSSGDIRADVCRTYLLYSEFSVDMANRYLRIYCSKSGILEDEVLQWLPIIAGARLSEHLSKEKLAYLLNLVHALTRIN